MNHDIKGISDASKVPPAIAMQGMKEPASGKAERPTLSAYTLALRDPGLFSSQFVDRRPDTPKQLH